MAALQTDARRNLAARPGRPAVLDLDPDLGRLLDDRASERARFTLRARTGVVDRGAWDVTALASANDAHLGLLFLEGVAAREVVIRREVSSELLGPGDLARPWGGEAEEGIADMAVRWNVLAPVRFAVLDRAFAVAAAEFPEVGAVLFERMEARARRLATTQAIGHIVRVEERLEAMLWHLAGRWGKVTREGVVLPLCLSHRALGELIGARRPTVSQAAGALSRRGVLQRRPDGSWLLAGDPMFAPPEDVPASVPQRRRLITSVNGEHGPSTPVGQQLLRDAELRMRELGRTLAETRELCRRSELLLETHGR